MYILLFLYLAYLIYHYDRCCNVCRKSFNKHYYFLLIIIISMAGFSYRMGYDSIKYENSFNNYSYYSYEISKVLQFNETKEPLWIILNVLINKLFGDFTALKLLIAAFVNSTIFWFLRKYSLYFFTSILLYLLLLGWTLNFEILRASITIALFLIAFDKIIGERPNYIYYYLWLAPALLFHWFAFVALFFPLFTKITPGKKFIIALSVAILITPLLIQYGNQFLAFNQLSYFMDDRISTYLNSDNFGSIGLNYKGIFIVVLTRALPIILLCYLGKNFIDRKIISIGLIYSLFVILQVGLNILYRITDYFTIITVVVITNTLSNVRLINHSKKKLIVYFAIVLLSIYIARATFAENIILRYVPYTSIFDKTIVPEREKYYYDNIILPN